jgi:GNAT superfamily N-acetyltransferase
MNHRTVLNQLNDERRSLVRDGQAVDVLPEVTRRRIGDQFMISYSALKEDYANAVISRETAYHLKVGVGFEWKLYAHDQPANMLALLKAHGFEIGACEAVMIYDLSQRPVWLKSPENFATRRIDSLEQVAEYRRLAETIFLKNYSHTADELAAAVRDKSSQHRGYMVYAGNEPVSIGRLYTHPKSAFAGLYGGATLEAYRRRGFYRALIAARARDAVEAGAKYLLVDALPTSRPILERLGFECVTQTWPCDWRPKGTAA